MATGIEALRAPRVENARLSHCLDGIFGPRDGRCWPVSLTLTALAVRQKMPACDLDNHELTEMIAIHAVERGRGVIFDADLLDCM